VEPNLFIVDSPLIYYKGPNIEGSYTSLEEYRHAMERYLDEVLTARIRLRNAWIPTHSTPCMAYGAVTVIIIETDKPYDRIRDLGWLESPMPRWLLINCGVGSLWHYDFDRD
jgi:hypothetical protein